MKKRWTTTVTMATTFRNRRLLARPRLTRLQLNMPRLRAPVRLAFLLTSHLPPTLASRPTPVVTPLRRKKEQLADRPLASLAQRRKMTPQSLPRYVAVLTRNEGCS